MAAMKRGHSLALGLMALALVACGGNGGGDNTTTTPVLGLTSVPRIEAILADPTIDPDYVYQDLLNIQTGDSVVFQLVNYDDAGGRHVLNTATFRTSDTLNQAGRLATNGQFQAATSDSGANRYIASANYGDQNYVAYYQIKPRQINLRGKVLAEVSNAPVYNATIDFYAPSNPTTNSGTQQLVGTVHTAVDGTFRVSLPAFNDNVASYDEAVAAAQITFTIRSSELPKDYYGSFVFKGKRYDAGSGLCRAPLLSNEQVSDSSGTTYLPYKTGNRYLIDTADPDNTAANGTILLAPIARFPEGKPDPDGCSLN